MAFECDFALFGLYGEKNVLPLGNFETKTYYVHHYPACPGSTNGPPSKQQSSLRTIELHGSDTKVMKKVILLVIGRLVIEDKQTYWAVIFDSERKLYALRATQISPDEEYEDECNEAELTPKHLGNEPAASYDQAPANAIPVPNN